MIYRVVALTFMYVGLLFGQASPYPLTIYKSQTFTTTGSGVPIQLNGLTSTSTVGSSYSLGNVQISGSGFGTATVGFLGSSDNGVTYWPIPIVAVSATPGTPANTVTVTGPGLYRLDLGAYTHVEPVISGSFTATSVTILLTASPNAQMAHGASGGVTKIVAGDESVTVNPDSGTGIVTLTATGVSAGVASIHAGTNVTVSGSTGAVTVNASSQTVSPFIQGVHFGDSLTFAYASEGGPASSWTRVLDTAVGIDAAGAYSNYGQPGWVAGQEDSLIYTKSIPCAASSLMTYMIGTNDLNFALASIAGGSSTPMSTFVANYQATLGAQAAYMATCGAHASVTFSTGQWIDFGNNAKGTATQGATATFSGTGTTLYIGTVAANSNPATANLTCDGHSVSASFNFQGIGGSILNRNSSMLTRVTGLGSGAHTCVMTNTATTGSSFVTFQYAAFVAGSTVSNAPLLLVEQIPDQDPVVGSQSSWETAQAAVVSALTGDGFARVLFVNNTGAVPAADYNDSLHFNNAGYYAFAQPSIAAINTALGTAYASIAAPSGYFNVPEADWCPAGINNVCVGYGSGQGLTTGSQNDLYGVFAGHDITTGSYNELIGFSAGAAITTGSLNVVMGDQALSGAQNGSDNVVLGTAASFRDQGSQNVVIGPNADAGTSLSGNQKVIIGSNTCRYAEGSLNVCVGASAGTASTGNLGSMLVTQTSASSGTAIFTFSLLSGVTPSAGQLVSTNTLGNCNGMLDITLLPISSATSTTFTVTGLGSGVSCAAEQEFGGANTTTTTSMSITSSQLAATGIATYSYSVTSGTNPLPGELVTITGMLNNRLVPLNTSGNTIQSVSGGSSGTMTVGGFFVGVAEANQTETGSGSTILANNIYNDTGVTLIGPLTGKCSSSTLTDATAIGLGACAAVSHSVQLGALTATQGFVGPYNVALSNNTGGTQKPSLTLTYSPTIVFDPSYRVNILTLTGDVTNYRITSETSGGITVDGLNVLTIICQDSVGGHVFNDSLGTGTGIRGFMTISPTANTCSWQTLEFVFPLSAWFAGAPTLGQ